LVIYLNCTMMHGLANLKFQTYVTIVQKLLKTIAIYMNVYRKIDNLNANKHLSWNVTFVFRIGPVTVI
jgi:hypothetical protein